MSAKCLFCMNFEGGTKKIDDGLDGGGGVRDREESGMVLRFWAWAKGRMKETLTQMARTAMGQVGWGQELDFGHVPLASAVRYLVEMWKRQMDIWSRSSGQRSGLETYIHGCQCWDGISNQETGREKMSEKWAARRIQHSQGQRDEEKPAKETEQERLSLK